MRTPDDIVYIGVDDHAIDLFEGQYAVPNGMAYNSYVVLDDRIAVLDTVDARFTQAWLDNLRAALNGRSPDYLIVQHPWSRTTRPAFARWRRRTRRPWSPPPRRPLP